MGEKAGWVDGDICCDDDILELYRLDMVLPKYPLDPLGEFILVCERFVLHSEAFSQS